MRTFLPITGVALLVAPSLAFQSSVQRFPMEIAARDTATHEISLAADMQRMQALAQLDQVTLTGIALPTDEVVDVQLTRIDVERIGLRFFADGEARPELLETLDLSLWKGTVVGDPQSEVRLSFSNYGTRGWIERAGELIHFLPRANDDGSWFGAGVLVTTERELARRGETLGTFCETEQYIDGKEQTFDPKRVSPTGPGSSALLGANGCNLFECQIAIETDFQLFQVFGNLSAETAYITTLLGYISDRYEGQINTVLTYPYVMFYTTAADPWNTADVGGSSGDMLTEFVAAWAGNIPMNADLAHFISGAPLGGGVAYLDVLGNPDFGFGVSGNIDSSVNFPVVQQPSNWDFMVISHELGHNFAAPHTHSVCPPLDECPPSQYFGPCQTQQTCVTNGTVMSYCHLCPGGTGNITTFFHPENVARMQSAAIEALQPLYGSISGQALTTISENFPTPVTAQFSGSATVTGVELMYRYNGGNFLALPMSDLGGGLYSASFPPANCSSTPEYYFAFSSPTCGTGTDPLNAPAALYSAAVGELVVQVSDNFESNTGWTTENLGASTGDWQRGIPVNDSGWAYDPESDADGSGQCYLTENGLGNTDVDGGGVRLISPALDTTGLGIAIQYAYYLTLTNEDGTDALLVEWSSNGTSGPWIQIERHTTDANGWRTSLITPAELMASGVSFSADTRVRFTANDDGSASIVEAGVDTFEITTLDCFGGGAEPYCATSPNSAGAGAVITSFGSVSISANNFVLVTGAAIPNGSGLFYYGPNQVQAPFGDGLRCVGGAVRRLYPILTADGIGSVIRPMDFTAAPANAGSHMITIGSTWNFQYWFRDGAAGMSGFNLSNGLGVTFTP
ncbi:MAG: hypothetical protein ACI8QZ_000933 [Chlamydiales bacterium]|jgi:hypothetical protein